MSKKLKIAGITTTRADYGHLYWPFKKLLENGYDLKVVVSGSHLSRSHGLSYRIIEKDGFEISHKLKILEENSDSPMDIVRASGKALIKFGECFSEMNPDLILLLGDRYEALTAAQAALIVGIPVAHLSGGDTTEGAFDESIRHAITKLSHIHFPTNEEAKKRIIQMGEDPFMVHNIGSPGIEYIVKTELLSRNELENELAIKLKEESVLVTYHPETLDSETVRNFGNLLVSLKKLGTSKSIIFTRPNADPLGAEINKLIDQFVKGKDWCHVFDNLGSLRYLSLVKHVNCVIGNSSSGLYEAPTLKTATVNIGDRQKGRLKANTVIDCSHDPDEISTAIKTAIGLDCSNAINPYGEGYSSEQLVDVLDNLKNPKELLKKKFYLYS